MWMGIVPSKPENIVSTDKSYIDKISELFFFLLRQNNAVIAKRYRYYPMIIIFIKTFFNYLSIVWVPLSPNLNNYKNPQEVQKYI